jgi:hypothetical protein
MHFAMLLAVGRLPLPWVHMPWQKNQGHITLMVSPLLGLHDEMVGLGLLSPIYMMTHAFVGQHI